MFRAIITSCAILVSGFAPVFAGQAATSSAEQESRRLPKEDDAPVSFKLVEEASGAATTAKVQRSCYLPNKYNALNKDVGAFHTQPLKNRAIFVYQGECYYKALLYYGQTTSHRYYKVLGSPGLVFSITKNPDPYYKDYTIHTDDGSGPKFYQFADKTTN